MAEDDSIFVMLILACLAFVGVVVGNKRMAIEGYGLAGVFALVPLVNRIIASVLG